MPEVDETQLAALLNTIVPPRDGVPGGGDAVFVTRVLADASDGYLRDALERVLHGLASEFASRGADERERVFAEIEAADQPAAAAVVNLAYTAYYSDRRVLRALESELGYRAVPPQPQGYDLPSFPVEVLSHRSSSPIWRK